MAIYILIMVITVSDGEGILIDNMRLLFLCENCQEVDALAPIASEIERLSSGRVQCEFASQDAFYLQRVDEALLASGVKVCLLPYPLNLSKPFPFNSLVRKTHALLATNRQLEQVMNEYDGLVCGVDSAPARMLIASAQRLGKPNFQVIISLYLGSRTNKSLRVRYLTNIKRLLKRGLAQLAGADFLSLPDGTAKSECNRIFVMGEKVKAILVHEGVPEERILAFGVPRFERLFELGGSSGLTHHSIGCINILYIPGAFAAHGMSEQHSLQQRQLREIVECLSKDCSGHYRLTIKLHPREREEDYAWLIRHKELVEVIPSNADLYKAILNCQLVATICSTVSYESILLRRPVIIATFPNSELLTFEPFASTFKTVSSVQDLIKIANNILDDDKLYINLIEKECQSVYDFIDPNTPESSSKIAWQICKDIGLEKVQGQ